jgi:hypothetical protein
MQAMKDEQATKLSISDDITAQKCRTLPSSVQWNHEGKQKVNLT